MIRDFSVDFQSISLTSERIQEIVVELGAKIDALYELEGVSELLVVVILQGSFMFAADLVRHISGPLVEMDFMAVSSYGDSTKSSGTVRIVKDLRKDITDRDVLLIEDIVDTGLTLQYLQHILRERHPRSLRTCALLSKSVCRKVDVPVEFIGTEVPDDFLVGYGLDFGQKYRNVPFIGVLKREICPDAWKDEAPADSTK